MKRNHNQVLIGVLALFAAGLLAGGGYWLGQRKQGSADAPANVTPERKPLYWHDPMVPGPRFDKPGKSPFMDMALVPVYADEAGGGGGQSAGVSISPGLQQNLGLRSAVVRRAAVAPTLDAIGTVQFDERQMVSVQTRVAAYVEKLAVRAPMEQVRRGQLLAMLYAPEWLAPIGEWLALKRGAATPELVAAARERLRALSIPDELIARSEASGSAQARFGLYAPQAGVVAELGVREGAAVTPGMTLFRLAGMARVWVLAELPEAQAPLLRPGQAVKAQPQADATQRFEGRVAELLPQLQAGTRTLQARFELDNQAGRLLPGMLMKLALAGPAASRLLLPAEALIRTGQRSLVIVRKEGGQGFEPREVQAGAEFGDEVEILRGLAEGEQVVASGQFLIDSEARLKSVLTTMLPPLAQPQQGASK